MPANKNGKRILIRAVQDLGLPEKRSIKIVNQVVDIWKKALMSGESLETPVGDLIIIPRETRREFRMKPLAKNQKNSIRVLYRQGCEVRLNKKKIDILNDPD